MSSSWFDWLTGDANAGTDAEADARADEEVAEAYEETKPSSSKPRVRFSRQNDKTRRNNRHGKIARSGARRTATRRRE